MFCTKSFSKTCNFATYLLLAFNEYKKKSCSLFARSFSMMLLTFDQVFRAWIEILTKCEQRNIAHMAVQCLTQIHAILQLIFCSLLMNTKRKAVLSSPAHSTWCYWHSIKFVGLESKYWRNASSAISPTCCAMSHSNTRNFVTCRCCRKRALWVLIYVFVFVVLVVLSLLFIYWQQQQQQATTTCAIYPQPPAGQRRGGPSPPP